MLNKRVEALHEVKTYTFDDPELGVISYVDGKRYLWLISVLFPLVPLIGMGLTNWSGQEWMLWIPGLSPIMILA